MQAAKADSGCSSEPWIGQEPWPLRWERACIVVARSMALVHRAGTLDPHLWEMTV
jgi:hypothetical protein